MNLDPKLPSGVVFDNYDEFVETCKDTVHDTVGIAYQIVGGAADLSIHIWSTSDMESFKTEI